MPSDRTGLFIFVAVVIILLIIGGMIFWKYDIKNIFKKEEVKEEVIYAELMLFARDKENNLLTVDYQVIDNSSRILQRGKLKGGVIERFRDTKENRSYILKAFGQGYYENTQDCPLQQDSCTVVLDKIAKVYLRSTKFKDDFSLGLILIEDGIIIDPILCTRWENLISFSINMTDTNVPVEYYNEYDRCYTFKGNLTEGLHQFQINHKITDKQPNTFELDLIDKCEGRYVKEDCSPTIILKVII